MDKMVRTWTDQQRQRAIDLMNEMLAELGVPPLRGIDGDEHEWDEPGPDEWRPSLLLFALGVRLVCATATRIPQVPLPCSRPLPGPARRIP
jgi:hypothetical protein